MSTKFEQLLDYLVNEEMDKANELFHEIVVEKSRDIYENLIAEEEEEDQQDEAEEQDDESVEEADEEEDESVEEGADEEADESMDLEDSYMMDGDDEEGEMGGDAADNFGSDAGMDDMEEPPEDADPAEKVEFNLQNAIDELEAAFAQLDQLKGGSSDDSGDFGADDEEDDGEGDMMGKPAFEGRRMTREYTEKVGKPTGEIAGANTGEKMPNPENNKAPLSSGKGKPTTGATAENILRKSATADEDGIKPHGKVGGLVKAGGKFTGSGTHNVDGVKSGIKTVTKQGAGYPGNNKTAGPVGSGTGDKAGQTSVGQVKSPLNGAPNRNA